MPSRTLITAEQFDALPEDEGRNRELLDGELIEVPGTAPGNNLILTRLLVILDAFVRANGIGTLLYRTDLAVGHDSRLRPDLALFSPQAWRAVDIRKAPVNQRPDIAIEIISPSETASMINRKIQAYLGWGVQEVWLIYPETRTVDVQVRGKVQILAGDEFLGTRLIPDWQIPVSEIFADV